MARCEMCGKTEKESELLGRYCLKCDKLFGESQVEITMETGAGEE